LSESIGKQVTKDMLRRFLKKLRYSYRRIRQWVKKAPDPIAYAAKVKALKELIELEQDNFLTIYYGDASGFSETPCVPYGWQEMAKPMSIPTQRGQRFNVFGLMSTKGDLHTYSPTKKMDSRFVINAIDDFVANKNTKGRAVIVLDNSSLHHSDEFKAKIPFWEEQEVYIFYLPPYSPHLNLIEILWRKSKYEWLLPQHFASFKTIKQRVKYIFDNFGREFSIDWNMAA
jgi:transposase